MRFVTGQQEMQNNLMMQRDKTTAKVGEAVERTCVDVANHAKAGHEGNMAHTSQRYRNRTSNLTNGIMPELLEVSFRRAHGIVFSGMDYSAFVEFGTSVNVRTGRPNRPYPFLTPALLANKEILAQRLKNIM